uniref:ATP synthase F0 subunit 8 n=1 Tax=Glaucosphaera vacuolata TaxID=38265 RepID=UPI001FCD73F0|nr:ATP synthase F0 subunit 8 [Glaucosphaera vacuolata]UNJ18763.1 ATP synthase F0 subunit 8 [Glaucosphaera vacuolata]
MPQLDYTLVFNQVFWLFLTLFLVYSLFTYLILPLLFNSLKLRILFLDSRIYNVEVLQKNEKVFLYGWQDTLKNCLNSSKELIFSQIDFVKR